MPDVPIREWSAGWLLASIVHADAGGPQVIKGDPNAAPLDGLAHVLAAGDAIDHAIFTEEEIEAELPRLRSAGLVTDDGYRPTAAGIALYDAAAERERYVGGAVKHLATLLAAIPLPDDVPELHLAPGELQRAFAEYSSWFDRVIATWD